MMKRREFITLLGGTAVAWPLSARAQQGGESLLVGMLETTSRQVNSANLAAFLKGLREFGFIEGQNLRIEYRSADGRTERFSDLANEVIKLNVNVIVTRGTPAALAAKKATDRIPIVMAANGDPVGSGLVASLARPGGNITGLSALVFDLYPKRVELLRDTITPLTRIVGFFNMDNPISTREWNEILTAARSFGIAAELFDIRDRDALEPAFDAAIRQRPNAAVVGLDTVTQSNHKMIAELATTHRLPAIYASREFVEAGGLLAYGVSYSDLYYRAATYVDQIRKGNKPSDIPVQQPTKFELMINLKTAKALGLEIPPTLLARADEVIE
jgi:putative tryptophan/tyrosine transport system substrate-binding protein